MRWNQSVLFLIIQLYANVAPLNTEENDWERSFSHTMGTKCDLQARAHQYCVCWERAESAQAEGILSGFYVIHLKPGTRR